MTMKKKLFTIALALCMILTMVPGGVSHSEVAWAANAQPVVKVKIAGVELAKDTPYYHNGTDGAQGTASNDAAGANATFNADTGTLTLNNLNVNTNDKGIQWGEEQNFDYRDLIIVIPAGTNNSITSTTTGIAGDFGYSQVGGEGPSLKIEGSGSLTVTSSAASGIWVWKDITIEGTPMINITAKSNGIANNSAVTKQGSIIINGGDLIIKGEAAAVGLAPTFDNQNWYSITAANDTDGTKSADYNSANATSYKYLKITKDNIQTETVGIYLRTLGVDKAGEINENDKIQVLDNQLSSLGISHYYYDDTYGHWVDYGIFESAKAATYDKAQNAHKGEEVEAVIAEMNTSAIQKTSGITFSNLDAVVWDTLSWSRNASSSNSWHLNGAIPLCKMNFDLNYPSNATGKETNNPPTRYAVKGTTTNTGFPTNPSRKNYTFDGWYTEKNGGNKLDSIPALTTDVTYYAHWSAKNSQVYSVTITEGKGMSLTSGSATQTDLTSEMAPVVYTAADGYYFPTGYSVTKNDITVTRNSETQITVSGTPTKDTEITLPAATKKLTITFNANGGWFTSSTHTISTVKVKVGENITVPIYNAIKSDKKYTYEFAGWYTEKESGTQLGKNTQATVDATYYAHWIKTPKEYMITYNLDRGTIHDTNYKTTYTFEDGTIQLPTNVTKDGYEFKGWKTSAGVGGSSFGSVWEVNENNLGNLTFYVWWTPFSAAAPQVSLDSKTLTVNRDDAAKLTVTAIPDSGTTYNLTYQWYKGAKVNDKKGNEISGETKETYTVPTDKTGTFYYYCKVTATRVDNGELYRVVTDTATVTVAEKQNTGGTSSSGGGYYTPSSAVTTSGSTDSKVTSSPTQVKNETTTDANGSSVTTATVTVSAANQREILRQAKANKSGEIVIKISKNDVKDAAKIALQLEKSFIEAVVADTNAKLIIQTPDGERTFTQDELKKLAAEATDKIVTVDPAEAEQAQPEQPADTLTPAQEKIVKGVENTNIDLRSQRTPGGNILLTWAKEKGYKVDYFEIYRSTKRSSGYGRKPFFRTPNGNWTKYLNTKNIKEGSTYYYKIRGVRIIDGKKYYTEYSSKAWRSVK